MDAISWFIFFLARKYRITRGGLERLQPNCANFVQMEGERVHQKSWRFRAASFVLPKRSQ